MISAGLLAINELVHVLAEAARTPVATAVGNSIAPVASIVVALLFLVYARGKKVIANNNY
jgi:hypothetical protein